MKFVGFDVETAGIEPAFGLQPFRARTGHAYLTSVAFARPKHGAHHARRPTKSYLREKLRDCKQRRETIVGWNVAFDMAWLIALGLRDEVFACNWLDGMLLLRHLRSAPNWLMSQKPKDYSLKTAVAETWPDRKGYEDNVTFNPTTEEEWAQLCKYNEDDASFTLQLCERYWSALSPEQRRAAVLEATCLPMVAEAMVEGICADADAARALSARLAGEANLAMVKLVMRTREEITDEILASPAKLRKLLFDDWKLQPVKWTPGGESSTDRDALSLLAPTDDRAWLLNEYREAKNNRTKFADGAVASLEYNGDGCVRPSPRVFGTYTGRMSYSSKVGKGKEERPTGVALHQWKRDPAFRDVITAPDGYTLLEFDFDGQEYRWMAVMSDDPTMLSLCEPGQDAHQYMADRVAGASRQLGKVANLCIAEGMQILTDRGPCNIEHVRLDDLVWDGEAFVAHAGVSFSGVRQVITYQGVTGTPDHRVLVKGTWVELQDAARHGWKIEPALGAGRTHPTRAKLRVVGGLVRRALRPVRRALCNGALSLWSGETRQPAIFGNGSKHELRQLCHSTSAPQKRSTYCGHSREKGLAKAGSCHAATMSQPQRPLISQLWRTGHRVPVFIGEGWRRLHSIGIAIADVVSRGRYRPHQQRWSLRAWQLALGFAQGEPGKSRQVRTYDIVNCGPNTRFAANGVVVHNSLQYRTSARTLVRVARVQHRLTISLDEATALWKTYRKTYPRVPRYWHEAINRARLEGYAETVAGRRVQLGMGALWTRENQWGLESTAINTPIQGSGAEQKYLALAVLRDYLPSVGGRFYFELHDGLYLIVPDNKAKQAFVEIKHLLDNLPYKRAWGRNLPVAFPVSGKAGKCWGGLTPRWFDV